MTKTYSRSVYLNVVNISEFKMLQNNLINTPYNIFGVDFLYTDFLILSYANVYAFICNENKDTVAVGLFTLFCFPRFYFILQST